MMKSQRPNDLKESNRISVLKKICDSGNSRAEIANMLEMSRPTVSSIVDELMKEGLVTETGHGKSTNIGGKRPIILDFNANAGLIVAVHFNDQWFTVAVTNLSGEIIAITRKESHVNDDFRISFDEVASEIMKLLKDKSVQALNRPCIGCGVSIKGLVDTELGTLEYSATIPQWRKTPIRDYLSQKLKMRVFIENDARALAISEMQLKPGVKSKAFALVNMGLGIGTGVVINNEIFRGANSGAVTFGHTTILENGPLCYCGNYGCWETMASASALLKELEKRDRRYKGLDIDEVYQLYKESDSIVADVLINHTGYWIGVGIANMLNVFNPEKIVIQGELNKFGDRLLQKIVETARKRALPVSKNVEINYSLIKDHAHIKASAAVVIKHFFTKEYHNLIWKKQFSDSVGL